MSDVQAFVEALLGALAELRDVKEVALRAEGPTVKGRVLFQGELFLAFYYNQGTQTQAFALVKGTARLWGVDYDKIRGWHLHPSENPERHVMIVPQSVSSIIKQLGEVLARI